MFSGLALLLSHGISGYLLVAAGIICLIIAADRIYTLYFVLSVQTGEAMAMTKAAVMKRQYSAALQICARHQISPEFAVIKEGLIAVESGREAMRSALSSSILRITEKCEKRLPFLALIASSATLLGLFGTIMGLIKTFAAIGGADPAEKARLLGNGISEAMYSTAAGVILGVFAMVIHTICLAKADEISGKTQQVALNFSNWIEFSERSQQ